MPDIALGEWDEVVAVRLDKALGNCNQPWATDQGAGREGEVILPQHACLERGVVGRGREVEGGDGCRESVHSDRPAPPRVTVCDRPKAPGTTPPPGLSAHRFKFL